MSPHIPVLYTLNGVQGVLVLAVLAAFVLILRRQKAFHKAQLKHDEELVARVSGAFWEQVNAAMDARAEARVLRMKPRPVPPPRGL